MKKLLEPFKEFINITTERIKNPLVGSFVLSWFIFNWKAVSIFLFSSKEIESRISDISENYCSWFNLIGSLALALLYVLFLPYITGWFGQFVSKAEKIKINNHYFEQELHLDKKEIIATKKNKIRRIESQTDEIDTLQNELGQSRSKINDLEKQLKELKLINSTKISLPKTYQPNKDITDKAKSFRNEFMNSNDGLAFKNIVLNIRINGLIPNNISKASIESLKEVGLISLENSMCTLTRLGFYVWLKYAYGSGPFVDENKLVLEHIREHDSRMFRILPAASS